MKTFQYLKQLYRHYYLLYTKIYYLVSIKNIPKSDHTKISTMNSNIEKVCKILDNNPNVSKGMLVERMEVSNFT